MTTSLLAILVASAALTTATQPQSERSDLGDGLYTIIGPGGNMLFSTGDDGTFVIDDQFANVADTNLRLIDEVSQTPIIFVLNTHYHGDHMGGNERFVNAGATVIAHDNVRTRLANQTGDQAVPNAALPVITFSETATFYWNGQKISVMHLPNAHTDGDAMVYFHEANVLHTGDLLFAGRWPYIDLDAGGSFDGLMAALQEVSNLADENTKIVPGHGPVIDESGLIENATVLREARALVRAEMMKGHGRDAVIANDPLAAYNGEYAWQFISGDRMTGQLFDDLMAADEEARDAVAAGPTPSADAEEVAAENTAPLPENALPASDDVVPDAAAVEAVLEEAAEASEEAIQEAKDAAESATEEVVEEAVDAVEEGGEEMHDDGDGELHQHH